MSSARRDESEKAGWQGPVGHGKVLGLKWDTLEMLKQERNGIRFRFKKAPLWLLSFKADGKGPGRKPVHMTTYT